MIVSSILDVSHLRDCNLIWFGSLLEVQWFGRTSWAQIYMARCVQEIPVGKPHYIVFHYDYIVCYGAII